MIWMIVIIFYLFQVSTFIIQFPTIKVSESLSSNLRYQRNKPFEINILAYSSAKIKRQ